MMVMDSNSDPTQRLFFALWPDAALRDALSRLLGSLSLNGAARIQAPLNLHLTLVFIGNVPNTLRPCLEQAADAVRGHCFTLQLDQLGYWPQPRVLWLGPSQVAGALLTLVDGLSEALAICGIKAQARPYRPHVTLARNVRNKEQGCITTPAPLVWQADRFCLVESCSAAQGVAYQVLNSWPLAGA